MIRQRVSYLFQVIEENNEKSLDSFVKLSRNEPCAQDIQESSWARYDATFSETKFNE